MAVYKTPRPPPFGALPPPPPYTTPPPPPFGVPPVQPRTPNPQGFHGVGNPPPRPQAAPPPPPPSPSRVANAARRGASFVGGRAKDAAKSAIGRVKDAAAKGGRGSKIVRYGAPIWEGLDLAEDLYLGAPEGATHGNIARGLESGGRLAAILAAGKIGGAGGAAIGSVVPGAGTFIGGLAGGLGGAYYGMKQYDKLLGENAPSREWDRLRAEQGLPTTVIPPMGDTVRSAVGNARNEYEKYLSSRQAPQPPKSGTGTETSDKAPMATEPYRAFRNPTVANDRQVAEYQPSTEFPGAWDSGVPGIGVRPGPSGESEFFNAGRFNDPIRKGELSVIPPGYIGSTPQGREAISGMSSAMRAAAARGDWDALERIGAIDRRGPTNTGGWGGGNSGIDTNDILKRAEALYERADRARSLTERSRYLKQARAMMSFAENTNDNATRKYGIDATLSRAAMGQGEVDPAKTILDLANARKANAEAMATEMGIGKLSAQELTALGTLGGRAGEQLLNSMAQDETQRHHLARIGAYIDDVGGDMSKFLEAYKKGVIKGDDAFNKSLANFVAMLNLGEGQEDEDPQSIMDWIRKFPFALAEGGYIPEYEVEDYAEGGYVPEMSAMAGYGMEDEMGPMGAMDMAGEGFGMPDPLMVEYSEYVRGAEKLGIAAIPFEEFAQMKQMSIPQAPEAPGMDQPYGAMGFAAGGQVPRTNQFGYRIDPSTGRSPVGQAGWNRHFDRENFPRPQQAAQPQPVQRPVQVQQSASASNPNYGPLAQSYGLNRQRVQAIRDQAKASGGVASYGDGMPSLMDTYGMGGNRFGGNNVGGFADGGMVPPFMDRHSAIQLAKGGGVPVGGKMVVDPNPNAPTDSIPAMIDGKRPAALDSGEFVIPRHAVAFHGVDKLNKLIAQAEKEPG
jgi:hypothetical protein